MCRIEPYFPLWHGVQRFDDRRVIWGIIFLTRNGLRWKDGPSVYGPPKTIYNRFKCWNEMGVFARIFTELTKRGGDTDEVMIDASHLKSHRRAASLLEKGGGSKFFLLHQERAELQAPCRLRRSRAAGCLVPH